MSDFGHTYQDEPVPECDCQRCAIATRDALRAEVERLREALEGASLALCAGAHGDNCYVDDYEFNRCICGKESALEAIDAALTPAEVTK